MTAWPLSAHPAPLQVATPWLADKGRPVVVLASDDPELYPGQLEVVGIRDGGTLAASCEVAAKMQRLRREWPEELDHVPRCVCGRGGGMLLCMY